MRDVRKCPKCAVRIEKNEGCPHMQCQRCNHGFCWCCMGPSEDHNNKCNYYVCPSIPFSFCCNILITITFMVFMPAIFILVPFCWIIWYVMCYIPSRKSRYEFKCWKRLLIWLLFIFILTPLALALGMTIAILVGALALIPSYLLSFGFLVRACIMACKTKI